MRSIPLTLRRLFSRALFRSAWSPLPWLTPLNRSHIPGMYMLGLLLGLLISLPLPVYAAGAAAGSPTTGAITGELGYPSDFIPPLRVYAINVGAGTAYSIQTDLNQGTFAMAGLPPGDYHVLAYYVGDLVGGYTQAVPCGLSVACTDHSLIAVTVHAGQTTSGVQVRDWYAPPGTFPAEPAESIPVAAQLPDTGAATMVLVVLAVAAMLVGGGALVRGASSIHVRVDNTNGCRN